MAIPLLIGAAALLAGGYGVKKGVDASQKNSQAKSINKRAQALIDNYAEKLSKSRKSANDELNKLGKLKIDTYNTTVKDFVKTFKEIKNVQLNSSAEIEELKDFETTLKKLESGINLARNMASSAVAGGAAGAVVAFGAYGGVMAFGAASTGAAISGLSGAAATNATLAWLGGGSLAAGGMGMAGGMAVLGGVVAGPLIAVFGSVMDSKATTNLENAKANKRKAESHVKEMEIVIDSCKNIAKRAELFSRLLDELNDLLKPGVEKLKFILSSEGNDFRDYSYESKEIVFMVASLSKTISTVINTPILSAEGALTQESLDTYKSSEEGYKKLQLQFKSAGLLN